MEPNPLEPKEPALPTDPKAYRLVIPGASEVWAALLYLPAHLFLVGYLLANVFRMLGIEITLLRLSLIHMLVGVVFLMLVMRPYLQESFARFLQFGASNIRAVLFGYLIRFSLTWLVAVFLSPFFLTAEFSVGPNEEVIRAFVYQDALPAIFMLIVLAPVVEEILFRGAIFAPLRTKSRFWAYFVSSFLFAFVHIVAFLLIDFDPNLFLVMLLYVPGGIALCWAYEKSGSIVTAILLHSFMNCIAIFVPALIA